MSEFENNVGLDEATETAESNINIMEATDLAADLGMSEEDELASLFASDIASIEEEAAISEDLEGFAKGFPEWDLHPPKK